MHPIRCGPALGELQWSRSGSSAVSATRNCTGINLAFGPIRVHEHQAIYKRHDLVEVIEVHLHLLFLRLPAAVSYRVSQLVQFEAQVRSIWLVWAASEKDLDAIDAESTAQTEAAANKILPGVATMVKALKDTGPPGCFEMLDGFRTMIVPTLNAFVHSGFHPLKQHTRGYPETLTIRVLKDSNAIFCMTTMQLAALTGDAEIIVPMSKIQPGFADCLPPLILRQKA
jgi:hypothetical protein